MATVLMEWDIATLGTGIASIDKHHEKLVEMINRLHSAMLEGKSRDEAPGILKELAEHTVMHFKHEEDIFDRIGYAGSTEHKQLHAELVDQVTDLQKDAAEGKFTVGMETMTFLKKWLTDHIRGSDFKYIETMKEHHID
ncbi:MAG: bacteriohemerythrin [Planctomycetes bacterium]|nr:bacteriohemerythrin [Planctomycetota bacterium]